MYNFGKTDDLPQNLQMKQAYKMYQYAKKLQNTYKIPTFSYFKDRKIPTFSYFGMKIPTFSYFFDLSYHFQPCSNDHFVVRKMAYWESVFPAVDHQCMLRMIQNIKQTTISIKLCSFQYRLLMNAIITNVQLYHYKIRDNNLCTYCNAVKESYVHLFNDCSYVQELKAYVSKITGIFVNYQQIIFNSVTENPRSVNNLIV